MSQNKKLNTENKKYIGKLKKQNEIICFNISN